MVVAVAFAHVVFPVVAIFLVNVGLLIGAFNAKLLPVSVLVYLVDWFAFNNELYELSSTSVLVYVVD